MEKISAFDGPLFEELENINTVKTISNASNEMSKSSILSSFFCVANNTEKDKQILVTIYSAVTQLKFSGLWPPNVKWPRNVYSPKRPYVTPSFFLPLPLCSHILRHWNSTSYVTISDMTAATTQRRGGGYIVLRRRRDIDAQESVR